MRTTASAVVTTSSGARDEHAQLDQRAAERRPSSSAVIAIAPQIEHDHGEVDVVPLERRRARPPGRIAAAGPGRLGGSVEAIAAAVGSRQRGRRRFGAERGAWRSSTGMPGSQRSSSIGHAGRASPARRRRRRSPRRSGRTSGPGAACRTARGGAARHPRSGDRPSRRAAEGRRRAPGRRRSGRRRAAWDAPGTASNGRCRPAPGGAVGR